MTVLEIKSDLLDQCHHQVQKRYDKMQNSISSIEESLFEETKCTSGDKHHTARAMLHIDRENAGRQLSEIEKLMDILQKINIVETSDYVRLGSLVYTDKAIYFISLSIGMVQVQNSDYICVALNSPIGILLSVKKEGESFTLNNEIYNIIKVA